MKTIELMIGDFVYYKSQVVRIISIDCIGGLVGIENETICELIGENELSPIPLTEKTLKANGVADQTITAIIISHSIQYVHELQHFLRLSKLRYIADNLKLE